MIPLASALAYLVVIPEPSSSGRPELGVAAPAARKWCIYVTSSAPLVEGLGDRNEPSTDRAGRYPRKLAQKPASLLARAGH